jgi:hypothetical protein
MASRVTLGLTGLVPLAAAGPMSTQSVKVPPMSMPM